jgi:DNA polymerase III subunit gamma/tau
MGDSGDIFGGEPPRREGAEPKPSAAELEAAGQSALFGGPPSRPQRRRRRNRPSDPRSPTACSPASTARRPFSELIGQEPMVRTLANAIERERLAHAFLMTGVRGVGKTSTARLIAKALNCIGPTGRAGRRSIPCGVCEPCVAIAEGRHIDVIEMDAASHTGVDDVREIIEAVRYAAVSARYKIYIIDEVHMLSRNAFNALLKTLEEPPAHVKFLFATTEVDKLPVTVLSRCQRFDLRRIPRTCSRSSSPASAPPKGVEAEPEALAIIASAAEGSSRDGLSILDQAIAHADLEAGGKVTAERVRDMLGLADKTALRRLYAALLEGDPPAMLGRSRAALFARRRAARADPLADGADPPHRGHPDRRRRGRCARRPRSARRSSSGPRGFSAGPGPPPVAAAAQGPRGSARRARPAGRGADGAAARAPRRRPARSGQARRAARQLAASAARGLPPPGEAAPAPAARVDWRELCEQGRPRRHAARRRNDARLAAGDRARARPAGLRARAGFATIPPPSCATRCSRRPASAGRSSAARARARRRCASRPTRPRPPRPSASAAIRWSSGASPRFPTPRSSRTTTPRRRAQLERTSCMDMNEMMKKAQEAAEIIQKQMGEAQAKLDSLEVEGVSGGGLVRSAAPPRAASSACRSTTA